MANSHSESDEFDLREDLILPESLRRELSKQYRPLVTVEEIRALCDENEVVAVGDMVCYSLISSGFLPRIAVFDFHTRRSEVDRDWISVLLSVPGAQLTVENPQGVLSVALWNALRRAWEFPGRTKIVVRGEEDLAGLASIYLMKGGCVVYGLPGLGMTAIRSDENSRKIALSILSGMVPVSSVR